MRKVIRVKFPRATDLDEALVVLARVWVIPFQQGSKPVRDKDGLFTRQSMVGAGQGDRPWTWPADQ